MVSVINIFIHPFVTPASRGTPSSLTKYAGTQIDVDNYVVCGYILFQMSHSIISLVLYKEGAGWMLWVTYIKGAMILRPAWRSVDKRALKGPFELVHHDGCSVTNWMEFLKSQESVRWQTMCRPLMNANSYLCHYCHSEPLIHRPLSSPYASASSNDYTELSSILIKPHSC